MKIYLAERFDRKGQRLGPVFFGLLFSICLLSHLAGIASAERSSDSKPTWTYTGEFPGINHVGEEKAITTTQAVTVTQHLLLPVGWNLISFHVHPKNPAVESIFILIETEFLLLKNAHGQIFWPGLEIDQIGDWQVKEGYQIYILDMTPFYVTGPLADPTATPISLEEGWNMVAYLRDSDMEIETTLAGIDDELLMAKNDKGQIYWPALEIDTIRWMKPGSGYYLYVTQPAVLTYPAN